MSGRSPISGVYECNACDSRWLRSQQIDALTAERDEALALADRIRRGMDLALEQQRERVAAAEAQVERYREVVEAAREFRGQHERFHPDHWCATDTSRGRCEACMFCAAIARLDADPPGEPRECCCGHDEVTHPGGGWCAEDCYCSSFRPTTPREPEA